MNTSDLYEVCDEYTEARDSLSYVQCCWEDESVETKMLCHHIYNSIYNLTGCVIKLSGWKLPATVEARVKMVYNIMKTDRPPSDCTRYLNWELATSRYETLPTRVECASTAYNLEIWALRLKKNFQELSGISVFYYAF